MDTSAESDPGQTIRKMQQVKRAALAPAEPSGADQAVAAQASQVERRPDRKEASLKRPITKSKRRMAGLVFRPPEPDAPTVPTHWVDR